MTILVPTKSAGSPGFGHDSRSDSYPPIASSVRGVLLFLCLGLLAFAGWAYFLPMAGGVVANGEFSVEANRRSVESKDGGTIATLHVSEGSVVERGDTVVTFDPVQAQANFGIADARYLRALAKRARLKAELSKAAEIAWPEEIRERSGEIFVDQLMDIEKGLLSARWQYLEGRREVLQSNIEELRQRRDGVNAEIASREERLALTRAEEKDVASLVERGYERRPRLLALRRDGAELQGEIDSLRASLLSIQEAENGTRLELANLDYERTMSVAGELTETEGALSDAIEQRMSAASLLENTVLRAPARGTVVDLQFFGSGGVAGPGERIFDLLPAHDALFVRAKLRPTDIDAVHKGQAAEVRLLAINQRFSDPLPGTVTHISADRLTDPSNGATYYEVFVKLTEDALERAKDLKLQAGMPADVVLTTQERTFVEYLLSPVSRALFLGFRED
ncbi:MAG: HlyD family type I secretion periplasmic adaptor subunit [Nisaea sp.]|uniref:HlyD family type I secretion periplasmic adaptor subunit n=1 Tax=Nisaea sp. TaxID=2024842 RepID=UPI001B15A170|nr:HlyD family type I secretion periplasmic adaptor subunit [Nisaea sp.]MBO6560818.1 HlyD family type I secretion periplasmic adaptor subunit [Nisaea sp.]